MDRPFYSITINGKNTWDEWKLMPVKAGKIDFAPPELRYEVADVAGSDDPLDFTEALTGYPLYKSRRGSIRFRFFDNGTSARNRFDDIKNFLHGKKCKVVIEDQPEYYYEGRMMVEELKFSKYGNWAEFDLSYILNAYKMEIGSSDEDWLWDPFNFETGIIREYKNLRVDGDTVIEVIGSRKPTTPELICSDSMTLTFNGNTYNLSSGKNIVPQIVLLDDEYEFTVTGSGTITIAMKAGML